MFYAICGIVFFASLAMMVREGIWSNSITTINIMMSGLVAFGTYAPLTIMVDEATSGSYTYLLDFLLIWAVFVVAMLVFRIVTDKISKVRLRLKHPFDAIGGPIMALLGAWVCTSFVIATLHTAPLAKDALGSKLVHDDPSRGAMTSPDLAFLHFVARTTKADAFGAKGLTPLEVKPFVAIYADHREKLENAKGIIVKR